MLHIFISAAGDDIRPGATGKPVPGYEARIVDDDGNPLPPGTVGRLAVRGPTGCRYLADPERQRAYVQNGWNLTGDMYRDGRGGLFLVPGARGRHDYLLRLQHRRAGIENVLREHPKVQECAVVGLPDAGTRPTRHRLRRACVTRQTRRRKRSRSCRTSSKRRSHPTSIPRAIEFVTALPYTETGKLQRFRLRQPGTD